MNTTTMPQMQTPQNSTESPVVYTPPGSKTLLIGDSGEGKTDSLTTFLEAGIQPFVIFTETGMSILQKSCIRRGLDFTKIHHTYVSQAAQNWNAMIAMAKNTNMLSYDALTKVIDANRMQHQQLVKVLQACNNFVCDRTKQSFGDVSSWSTDRVLIIDSMSGLNEMAMSLVVGERPTRGPQDWQVAQNHLKTIFKKLLTDLQCHVVITGHLEREKNDVTGEILVMASSLGKKLAPDLPKNFDDVILAEKNAGKFKWSTLKSGYVLKNRFAPLSDNIPPTFAPLIEEWKANGGVIIPTETKAA